MILSAIEDRYEIEALVLLELAEMLPFADEDFDFNAGYGTIVKIEQN